MTDLFTESGAVFSACRRYRLRLWRTWNRALPPANFLLLNPSTADELADDATIVRCEKRARLMRHGGLIVTNAFALRSTDPQALYGAADPVGPGNDAAIAAAAAEAALVVCGWGEHCDKVRPGRGAELLAIIAGAGRVPHALALNHGRTPKHPLYCGYALQPLPIERFMP